MSLASLVVDAQPSRAVSAQVWVERLDVVVGAAQGIDIQEMTDGGLLDLVARLTATTSQLSAVKLAAIAEIDARNAAPGKDLSFPAATRVVWVRRSQRGCSG